MKVWHSKISVRMPFVDPCTNQTCSHTFCRECIVQSLRHSPQCPIDRSALRIEDIQAADPIVRSVSALSKLCPSQGSSFSKLVDELLVKCSNESAGCSFTCQRQLLDVHVKNDCPFTLVPCKDGCSQDVCRKDRDMHICPHTLVQCKECEQSVRHIDLKVRSCSHLFEKIWASDSLL